MSTLTKIIFFHQTETPGFYNSFHELERMEALPFQTSSKFCHWKIQKRICLSKYRILNVFKCKKTK